MKLTRQAQGVKGVPGELINGCVGKGRSKGFKIYQMATKRSNNSREKAHQEEDKKTTSQEGRGRGKNNEGLDPIKSPVGIQKKKNHHQGDRPERGERGNKPPNSARTTVRDEGRKHILLRGKSSWQ